ncbi:hypothetical protein CO038_00025 [Candidatus Pacearchaeota archaeon CG_4_9_14_0_2_um_filter_39_13]|nr:DUF362 domain-containing protein [Candidatus Pacearchaeota archaeon]OIO43561.1 MAG: hypothetical protein AUJ64_02090 [Candidatus Pacearchaeota archaeon CG1_02_39_14]PJC45125.1 MAG: hypothetical protein CO038_00025 [Candidatus Pacearchaeota archaeon CG_4_9_14_0_2_um_filter_39_13]
MVKGVSIKFQSYQETLPKLLKAIGFDKEIKRHERIILKPNLMDGVEGGSTKAEFVDKVLGFVMSNKNPGTEVYIAEGCDGFDTEDIFDEFGYRALSEKYGVGLIDLNNTDTEFVENDEFLRFEGIHFPKIMEGSFVVSLPYLKRDEELSVSGALVNMLGAFPASHYKGFFSKGKSKIKKWPLKYAVHDILKCKMPEFTIIDASDKGHILAGRPLDMDKQAVKSMGLDWKEIPYLRLIDESFENRDKNKSE